MQYNNTQKRATVFDSAARPGYDYKCVLFLRYSHGSLHLMVNLRVSPLMVKV